MMDKYFKGVAAMSLIGCIAIVLVGCYGKAQESKQVTEDFNVQRLFTHDGCTVYRFKDGGYNRYYTTCRGSTNWTQSHGKSGGSEHAITTEAKQ